MGLVDRDGRSPEDVARLATQGVQVLEWAEIENLLLCEEALVHVAEALYLDTGDVVVQVKAKVLEKLAHDVEHVACMLAGREIDRVLRSWAWKHNDEISLKASLSAHLGQIDAVQTTHTWRKKVQDIISTDNYEDALRIYPNKGLLALAGRVLQVAKYDEFLLRRITRPEGQNLVSALQRKVPVFQR